MIITSLARFTKVGRYVGWPRTEWTKGRACVEPKSEPRESMRIIWPPELILPLLARRCLFG